MAKKSSTRKPTKIELLRGTIGRAVDEKSTTSRSMAPQAMPAQETAPASAPVRTPEKSNTGEATVLWFHPEDKQRIRELVAYLASQGVPAQGDQSHVDQLQSSTSNGR